MAKRETCPICGEAPTTEFKPFCGRGCKDRDLLQWLGDGYRLPGEHVDPMSQSGLDSSDSPD
jgi:uncharacterized protein